MVIGALRNMKAKGAFVGPGGQNLNLLAPLPEDKVSVQYQVRVISHIPNIPFLQLTCPTYYSVLVQSSLPIVCFTLRVYGCQNEGVFIKSPKSFKKLF